MTAEEGEREEEKRKAACQQKVQNREHIGGKVRCSRI